jgi:hypothetical protein
MRVRFVRDESPSRKILNVRQTSDTIASGASSATR